MLKDQTIVNFYRALQKKDVTSILSGGKSFLRYLKQYSGSYKPNGVLRKILMIEWKAAHIPERNKAIIQAAISYFENLLNCIEKEDIHLHAYIANIKTGVADLKPTICAVDKEIDFDFLLGNTNIQLTPIQFKIVQSLFFTNSLPQSVSKYDLDHVVVPFLRTVLESKIKGILGIDILRNNKNQAIDLSTMLRILPKLTSIKLHQAYDVSVLSMIMDWLNHFMHRNIRPEPFILNQVIQYVDPIFHPGKIKHERGILFSINSSAFADDIDVFHNEVESILNSQFSGCYIAWKRKEVSVLKRNK